ncbi:right-handed parallel beta-helix repeat-containing protein, partial [Candidatus Micrarchaeota archaeon]|nr:right-handed parallel beta-helix repeat-containing protein [Candidatus Micrarchaeota archaeon]
MLRGEKFTLVLLTVICLSAISFPLSIDSISPANNSYVQVDTAYLSFTPYSDESGTITCAIEINEMLFEGIEVENATVSESEFWPIEENQTYSWSISCEDASQTERSGTLTFTAIPKVEEPPQIPEEPEYLPEEEPPYSPAEACTCDSCTSCTSTINNASCDSITLTTNITVTSSPCINNPASFSNKVFDCDGFTISGSIFDDGVTVTGKSNITILNCVLDGLSNGLNLNTVHNSTFDNITCTDGNYGIQAYECNDNNFSNIISYGNDRGIRISYDSYGNIVLNSELYDNTYYGISVYSNTTMYNITSYENEYGVYFDSNSEPAYNLVNASALFNNTHGAYFLGSSNNTIEDSEAMDNDYGLTMVAYDNEGSWLYSENNTVLKNQIYNNNYGISLDKASLNLIYNNFLNNTNNTVFDSSSSYWNISKTSRANVMGGPYTGGNFWAKPDGSGYSQSCSDLDSDGLCDSAHTLDGNNTDYLPLAAPSNYTHPIITIFSPLNTTYFSSSVDLNYTVVAPSPTCWYSLNGGTNTSLPGCANTTISPLSQNNYSLVLYANDSSGNESFFSVNFTVIIDNDPPIIDYTAQNEPNDAIVDRPWAFFEINYTEANRNSTTLNLNGSIVDMDCNSTNCWLNKSGLNSGYYVYNISMTDALGNSNTTPNRNLTVNLSYNAVSSCINITQSGGTYILISNLSSSSNCINIRANNTYLDCDGYSIIGDGSGGSSGIYVRISGLANN